MWIRKTQFEKKNEARRRRFNPKDPALFTIAVLLLSVVTRAFGCSGLPAYIAPPVESLEEFVALLSSHFTPMLLIGAFLYGLQVLTGWSPFRNKSALCNQCFTAARGGLKGQSHACGGLFEPMDDWKWVEHDGDESTTHSSNGALH